MFWLSGMTDTGYQCWGGYYCPTGLDVPNPAHYLCPRGMHCPNGSEIYKVCHQIVEFLFTVLIVMLNI